MNHCINQYDTNNNIKLKSEIDNGATQGGHLLHGIKHIFTLR